MKTNFEQTALKWLKSSVIEQNDKDEISLMIENNKPLLEEAFYTNLEFGTGGLRGIMGIGTNRMNKYTVGMATQGLANYLKNVFQNQEISVVIARDSRINSDVFTQITSEVLTANDIKVFVFEEITPTPVLSFAVRQLKCKAGIMITASHNPKEYNGYKVYWEDGGQLVSPHDENVINEVFKISSPELVNFKVNSKLINKINGDLYRIYLEKLKTISLFSNLNFDISTMSIVYTPLHGTGYKLLPEALNKFGFTNVIDVYPQNLPDGNFPTVISPNPEEKEGMKLAIEKAKQTNADIIMATDPDADRLGVGVKDKEGNYVLLNGNQTAALITYYILEFRKNNATLDGKQMIVKTIVTTDLLNDIAEYYNVKSFEVLTGFKYIADIILKQEGKLEFVCGGEESYGFLAGDFVRDKDAILTACLFAETAAWAASKGMNILDLLKEISLKFGLYREKLVSLTKKGISGMNEIAELMNMYRTKVPKSIANVEIIKLLDYNEQMEYDKQNNTSKKINLPQSNVIQYLLNDGSKITMRPSGTEPKIKFYFSVKGKINSLKEYDAKVEDLDKYLEKLHSEILNF